MKVGFSSSEGLEEDEDRTCRDAAQDHERLCEPQLDTNDTPHYKSFHVITDVPNIVIKPDCILSIDIGYKNLGYTIFKIDRSKPITLRNIVPYFDVFNMTAYTAKLKLNTVESRCIAVHAFFEDIAKKYNITRIIIEKQVPSNTIAMELMYSIYTKALQYCEHKEIIIFDPKLKFSSINEEYDTKNKKHKRQSILYAGNAIKSMYPDLLQQFNNHSKKDDIADSFNMLLVNMIDRKELDIDFDQLRKLYGL